jgi:hypothetical protein
MSSEGFTPCQPFRPIGFARTTRRYASSWKVKPISSGKGNPISWVKNVQEHANVQRMYCNSQPHPKSLRCRINKCNEVYRACRHKSSSIGSTSHASNWRQYLHWWVRKGRKSIKTKF